jgi:multiple sugar transport system substrate-binding protein
MASIIRSPSRRDVLKVAGLSGAGALLGARSGRAATKTLSFMHESSFIQTYDDFFKKTLAPEYEKATGIAIDYQLISVGSLQTRMATAAETGNGPDMTLTFFNWPFLFDEKLADVSDIAEGIGTKNGCWYDSAKEAVIVNGKWKAIPFGNVGQIMNWRTDWFEEVGIKEFPDTWDGFLEAGTKLKKAGHPFGLELGHGFGDNHGWLYPLLWSFGGREVEPDGKTIAIDSDETARAVDYCRNLFRAAILEDCLGWTDPSNNKAWMSEQISCTNNAESILWFAKKQFPDIGKVTQQSLNPQGPKGRFHILAPWSHAIYSFSPNIQASKDFLVWLNDPKQIERWYASADSYYAPYLHAYDDAPLWHVEPRNLPYRDSLKTSHLPGWPAPIGRAQAEAVAKYVVVDMFAKACTGKSTKEVIADAAAQLKQIYKPA